MRVGIWIPRSSNELKMSYKKWKLLDAKNISEMSDKLLDINLKTNQTCHLKTNVLKLWYQKITHFRILSWVRTHAASLLKWMPHLKTAQNQKLYSIIHVNIFVEGKLVWDIVFKS